MIIYVKLCLIVCRPNLKLSRSNLKPERIGIDDGIEIFAK